MKVYQIYFKEEHKKLLEPQFIPFENKVCSIFFESFVMRYLIDHGHHRDGSFFGDDYFGVVSYKVKEKLGYMKTDWKNARIANRSVTEFTVEQFERELHKHKPDAMSFQRHDPHDTVMVADGYHPGFRKYWVEIMSKLGYHWEPGTNEDVFYCNYFVAKATIYERFVKEMLAPAMDVMMTMPELLKDSYYRPSDGSKLPENLQKQFGITHYPFHPFICERMFTYFATLHNLKCLHY